ncbi:ABC transporter ATP-binding protein [Saccharicrinis sp. FJH62]|uniref:ABC transporter ATP-binding protein n=1 Tax=Saccharicrinis sp. FJH62 TaxID=3344657 RepID=UPI0035D4A748
MKDFFKILRRFIPPYKTNLTLNIVLTILSTFAGLFSFYMMKPILEILFGISKETYIHQNISYESIKAFTDSLSNNFYYYIGHLIDMKGKSYTLGFIGIFLIVFSLLKTGLAYLAAYSIIPMRAGISRDIRDIIYKKILDLPIGFFSEQKKGDIMSRMSSDVQEVENSIFNSIEIMFKNPIIILIYLVTMVYMSWRLTIFVFVLLPISGTIIGRIGKTLKRTSNKGQIQLGIILSNIEESLSGLRIIKAFNAEHKSKRNFRENVDKHFRIQKRLMRKRQLAHPVSELLGTIVIVIVLWYGGKLIFAGSASLEASMFMVYLVIFYSIINPAKAFSTGFYSIQKGLASMERIDEILQTESNIVDKKEAEELTGFHDKIEYKDVSFKYEKEMVLSNIDISISKGKTVALVGQSGSGKTTLVDLLPRFYDVTNGEIIIDGHNIKNVRVKSLRHLMGNVNQDPILFNDTFYNNIAFGLENSTKEEVIAAAKVANAHEFIMETEFGYDTNIGDRGSKLSGGQRQRISIARAVLANPPILILDEATSALDTESERLVQDALENLMKNRTTIVIAHRLSTVRNADEICVMHEGKIVERGKHEDLLSLKGIYKKLHDMQMF